MLKLPTTIAEIDQLIKDQVQEDIHLDYKASPAIDRSKRGEIAKDVSAFANSDGGILIYGVVENNNLPDRRDGGIDHAVYSREWLEQIISSQITPRIDGIRIAPIQVTATHSYYAVQIPTSFRGPHQAPDKKYYKRFNFQSVPMEDYEIRDIRNRQQIIPRLLDVGIYIRQKSWVYLTVSNIGEQIAEEVTFEFPKELLTWVEKEDVRILKNGIKFLPPGRVYTFRYGFINALVQAGSPYPSKFDVIVKYKHLGVGQLISDTFHIDLMDYWGSSILDSEIHEHGKQVTEAIKKLTEEVRKLNGHVSRIVPIAGSTGLDLSITTLKNLKHIFAGDDEFEKLDPAYLDDDVFKEVLGVDNNTALQLRDFFSGNEVENLNDVEGMTEELIEKVEKFFILEDKSEDKS